MPFVSPIAASFTVVAPASLETTVQSAIRAVLPDAGFDRGRRLTICSAWHDQGLYTEVGLAGTKSGWSLFDQEITANSYSAQDRDHRVKERVRLGVMKTLTAAYGLPMSPWGILVGVRPTKLVHNLGARGFDAETIKRLLVDVYGLAPAKVKLVTEVCARQVAYFNPDPNRPIGLYVGIPFCPTRCRYCSFPAYSLESHGHLLDGFLEALLWEIRAIGGLLQELDVAVESVYLGGGTPTTLRGAKLVRLLENLARYGQMEGCEEFTVEAGRPETLTTDTVGILGDSGVDRVSINPQTMRWDTLKTIGRMHTPKDVLTAFARCREQGIPVINSDIILGLPGETLQDVEFTLGELAALRPDNLTVHGLARKRAADWRQESARLPLASEQGDAMREAVGHWVRAMGMEAYYLYRQRFMFNDMENVGYARPGTESLYNIQMMEERQTIVGVGAGAITKLVGGDLAVQRLANPKCPATYSQGLASQLPERIRQLREWFSV